MRALTPVILIGLLTGACADDGVPQAACLSRADCPVGYTCDTAAGICVGERECADDSGCCPHMLCVQGSCREAALCSADLDCAAAGRSCRNGVCVARDCAAGADCAAPQICHEGLCSERVPCGGCGQDACDPMTGRCLPATVVCDPTSCPPGQVLLVDNYDELEAVGPQCSPAMATCRCAALPALSPPELGGWLAHVSTASGPMALGRDRRYGDLVATSLAGGQVGAIVPLAGVPSGPVVADPTGPRGGVAAPGPDVGRFTSAVSLGDSVAVLTHDATQGDLIYVNARVDQGIPVNLGWHPVDTEGRSGMGADLTRADDGWLHAVWFTVRDDGTETLRYGTAGGLPSAATDWTREILATGPGHVADDVPCPGGCALLEACVDGNAGPECVVTSLVDDCDGCDRSSLCVAGECRTQLRRTAGQVPWRDEPGSESQIALHNQFPLVAWYDRRRGALLLGAGQPGNGFEFSVVDGDKGADIGRGVRLATAPGVVALAYRDASRDQLRLLYGSDPADLTPSLIDSGGHGLDLDLSADGQLVVVYSDAFGEAVRVASGAPGSLSPFVVHQEIHVGRFNSLLMESQGASLITLRDYIDSALQLRGEVLWNTLSL
jgi:hypothetical protein